MDSEDEGTADKASHKQKKSPFQKRGLLEAYAGLFVKQFGGCLCTIESALHLASSLPRGYIIRSLCTCHLCKSISYDDAIPDLFLLKCNMCYTILNLHYVKIQPIDASFFFLVEVQSASTHRTKREQSLQMISTSRKSSCRCGSVTSVERRK